MSAIAEANKTAMAIKRRYEQFVDLYPEVFISDQDKRLRFSNATIAACVEELSIPDFADANDNVCSSFNNFISFLT